MDVSYTPFRAVCRTVFAPRKCISDSIKIINIELNHFWAAEFLR